MPAENNVNLPPESLIFHYKYFIGLDEHNNVIKGFTSVFEEPQEGVFVSMNKVGVTLNFFDKSILLCKTQLSNQDNKT